MHVCLPSHRGHTRLLYRMSLDFLNWTRYVPGIKALWRKIAGQVGFDAVFHFFCAAAQDCRAGRVSMQCYFLLFFDAVAQDCRAGGASAQAPASTCGGAVTCRVQRRPLCRGDLCMAAK
jgi:hypothetical protein